MVSTKKTKKQLLDELEVLHARVESFEAILGNQQQKGDPFRLIIEKSPTAVTLMRDGVLLYANPACLAMFGYDKLSAMLGKSLADFIVPRHRRQD